MTNLKHHACKKGCATCQAITSNGETVVHHARTLDEWAPRQSLRAADRSSHKRMNIWRNLEGPSRRWCSRTARDQTKWWLKRRMNENVCRNTDKLLKSEELSWVSDLAPAASAPLFPPSFIGCTIKDKQNKWSALNQRVETPRQQHLKRTSPGSAGIHNVPVNYRNVLSQLLWPSCFTAAAPSVPTQTVGRN